MSPLANPLRELFWYCLAIGFAVLAICLCGSNAQAVIDHDDSVRVILAGSVLASVAAVLLAARAFRKGKTVDETSLRTRAAQTVTRMADAVRDTILDWSLEEELAAESREPLPPLDPQQLVDALRGPTEEALHKVAELLNETRDEATCQHAVRGVVENLVRQALERGEQLRIDAAVAALSGSGPHGTWVEKYRRMRAESCR
jgi:hypothetical protein